MLYNLLLFPFKNATGANRFASIILSLYSGRIVVKTRNDVVPLNKKNQNLQLLQYKKFRILSLPCEYPM